MNQPNHEASFRAIREEANNRRKHFKESALPKIHIGMATCGIASGALETKKAFEEALAEQNMSALIHPVGCLGHCYAEPLVIVENPGFPPILYYNVTAGKAGMIVKSFLRDGDPLFEYLLGATEENDLIPQVKEFPRFSHERRVVTDKSGLINPEDIDDYIAEGGYETLAACLGRKPEELLSEILECKPDGFAQV